MNQPEVMQAAFTVQFSFSDIFQILMPILGIGAVLLFVLVLCGIFGLCRSEKNTLPLKRPRSFPFDSFLLSMVILIVRNEFHSRDIFVTSLGQGMI